MGHGARMGRSVSHAHDLTTTTVPRARAFLFTCSPVCSTLSRTIIGCLLVYVPPSFAASTFDPIPPLATRRLTKSDPP